ncbi:MAG: glycoside hydrolase family 3 protein [Desulfovibrionaceae bacterium]|nr:glycoside hydrolase family 3 protein [Desulfovibrionaceae bacterium]
MAGAMIMVGFRGTEVPDNAPLLRALAEGRAGGVILFSRDILLGTVRNIESPSQVRALIARLKSAAAGPLLVAVDQEGGRVQRLSAQNGFQDWPSAREWGLGDPEATYAGALGMGAALAGAGFNLNFAPCVDLDMPDSPAIGALDRAFHRRPERVTAHARAFIRAMTDAGVISTLKHFPGHGSARGDTHLGFVDVDATWTPDELEPYRTLLDEGFDGVIMVAHVCLGRYGDAPADLNPAVIEGLLRAGLGWQGVVATDDLQMEAVTAAHDLKETILLAVNAGADVLVFGNNLAYDPDMAAHAHAALLELVAEGRIAPARLRASWERIEALKERLR